MTYPLSNSLEIIKNLRDQLNIAVVYAGDPDRQGTVVNRSFNPRCWKSYRQVAMDISDALHRCGFTNIFLLEENRHFSSNLEKYKIDLVWINSAGVQGYDSACHAAAILESLGIPYIGHTPLNAALMDQKYLFKTFLNGIGLATAPSILWHPEMSCKVTNLPGFNQIFPQSELPVVVKPVCGRASNHIHIAYRHEDIHQLAVKVYEQTRNSILIEQYLSGEEYCVAVMGTMYSANDPLLRQLQVINEGPFCFAHFERQLDGHPIFVSMDKQPVNNDRVRILDFSTEADTIRELNELAIKVYKSLNLNCLVRLDVRRDCSGQLNILEANPKPDLKYPHKDVSSLIAMGLAEQSVQYDDMIFSLVANMIEKSQISRADYFEKLLHNGLVA